MKNILFVIFIIGSISSLFAQGNYHSVENLIPNPGFEQGYQGWLGKGIAIYSPPSNVPQNALGNQYASEGNNYGCLYESGGLLNENLSIQLIEPLIQGVRYQISFQASLIDGNASIDPTKAKFKSTFYDDYNYANSKPQGNKSSEEDWEVSDQNIWNAKYYEFTADRAYSHLVIEMRTQIQSAGVYLDDFKITECAYNSCSQTQGIISPQFINNTGDRFGILGLENVSSIRDIEIFSQLGSLDATEEDYYSVNGIKQPFYIDDHGLMSAWYYAKFKLGNDCDTKSYNVAFFVGVTGSDFYTEPRKVYSDVKIPVPSCSNLINLKSGVIDGGYPVVALQSITNSGDVIIPSTISNFEFVAGSSIHLTNGFKVEKGADFKLRIGTASSQKSTSLISTNESIADTVIYNNSKSSDFGIPPEDIEVLNLSGCSELFPNPNNGIFEVRLNNKLKNYFIDIFDINGLMIYSDTKREGDNFVDIRSKPNGVYLIVITGIEGTSEVHKIVKH